MNWGLTVPPFVFNPVFSFQSITALEITLEMQELVEGNAYFKRHLIAGGSLNNLTLQRGATFYDAEFWNWISAAVKGDIASLIPPRMGGHRRNLLLIQHTNISINHAQSEANIESITALADALVGFGAGNAANLPARAWMLFGCLPVRYKVAGDFDATSGGVSVMELELCMDRMEEFAMTAF